jgi:O-antigen ligase
MSLFRGAMAGTFAAILVATFLVEASRRRGWLRTLLVTFLAVVAVILILVATIPAARATFRVAFVGRIEQVIEKGGGGSIQFRQLETESAMEDIRRQPILGYGPGVKITKHFDPEEYASSELYLHSGYVWFWYKMGVLGLGVVAAFFLCIYGTCISLLRRSLHPIDRGWVVGTLAATVAMLPVIHANNMLIRSQGAYALTLLLVTLCLIVERYRGVPRDQLPPGEKAVAG